MSGTQNERRKMHVSTCRRESIPSSSDSSSPSLFDQSVSSVISALTLDEETFEISSRFGPTLKAKPEQQYLDRVRLTSSSRFSTSIGPTTETSLCDMPKRQSSTMLLDHEMWTDLDDHESDYQTTELEDPSKSQGLSNGRFHPCPSALSLDLDDIFEEKNCSDTSPQIAKRNSSVSSNAASSKNADLFVNICEPSSPGDERFQVACSKEKAKSIAMPSRQMSRRLISTPSIA